MDMVLGYLMEARASLLEETKTSLWELSREGLMVLNRIDEAILWRKENLRLSTPPVNEKSEQAPS